MRKANIFLLQNKTENKCITSAEFPSTQANYEGGHFAVQYRRKGCEPLSGCRLIAKLRVLRSPPRLQADSAQKRKRIRVASRK